jgi:sugar phosphate isomerase/epimerase
MRNRKAVPDRREFLGALAAGAAWFGPAMAAAPAWQIGCWTRPWSKVDRAAAFDGVAGAGFRFIGLMNLQQGGKPAGITWQSTAQEAAALGREAERRGLKVISVWGGGFPFQKSHEDGVAGLKRLVDNCAACGSLSLLLGGVGKAEQTEPYYRVVAECTEYAAGRKVGLSVKPHGGTNATGSDCRKIVERVGRKNFGIFYDPGNIYYYSDGKLDPVEDAPSVNGLVVGMIVKDFKMPKEVMLTPGTGMVNFREVLARLKKGGFTRGPLVVECLEISDPAQINAEAKKARLFLEDVVRQVSKA